MGRYKGKHSYPLSERFKRFVSYSSPDKCWHWIGGIHGRKKCKYGTIRDDHPSKKTLQAHRVSWILYKGTIPDGMKVLHKCDNSLCVNPDHLFLGNQRDNVIDCWRKNRHVHKLTIDQAKSIRFDPRPYKQICKTFHVSPMTVSMIKNNKIWKHI